MAKSRLDNHRLIPFFHLRAKGSQDFDSSYFKRKKNLLIFFLTSIEMDYLFKIEDANSAIRAQDTETVLISPLSPEEIEKVHAKNRLTFWLLSDESREVFSQFFSSFKEEEASAVFVVDKTGSLFFQCVAAATDGLPPLEDIIKSLTFIESQHK